MKQYISSFTASPFSDIPAFVQVVETKACLQGSKTIGVSKINHQANHQFA